MTNEPTTIEKLRGLPWSIGANVANTIFCQFTFFGSVFPLFLSELGLNKSQMGFLFSLMPFCGLIAPLIAPATARFGYKNTYLVFWGTRKIFTAFLLLTPWVLMSFGLSATLLFVSAITAIFAISRAVAETARVPWAQEYVPAAMQGKYTATSNIFTSLAGFIAVAVAGYILARTHDLSGFMLLIGVGVFWGFVCVWLWAFVPGGAPSERTRQANTSRDLQTALQDHNFLLYLVGVSVIVLATTPIGSFLPLYMQEKVGLQAGTIVFIQMGSLLGNLLTSYSWGWAADRYGSKPVMLAGISLRLIVPVALLLIPSHSVWSLTVALTLYFVQGAADMGWGVGSTRMLYVSVVPPDKKGDYLALYAAWIGIVGGLSQLAGGWALDASQRVSGQWGWLQVDAYTPLILSSLLLTLICLRIFQSLRGDNRYGLRQFTGIFLRGNPFLAMGSLIRYQLAHDEEGVVRATEQLGQAKSPLTVDELLEALADPRFHVRFEAVVTIARMPPDPRLVNALIDILNGTELALEGVAAWALGRMGHPAARPHLRDKLNSPYHSIRAYSARALGKLRDQESAPLLLERIENETDKGLQMAYASALGNLGTSAGAPRILAILAAATNPGARLELALALARLTGDEHHFVQLVRASRQDLGTAAAGTLDAMRKKLAKSPEEGKACDSLLTASSDAFARNQMELGVQQLCEALGRLPLQPYSQTSTLILQECAAQLAATGSERTEYLLLALHILTIR
jgi:MFS family permease